MENRTDAMTEKLFTVREAAAVLRVHPETVRRYIREGSLGATRLGIGPRAQVRISESQMRKFLSK